MIVRLAEIGQFDLDDQAVRQLDRYDTEITNALHAGNADDFHRLLAETIEYVRTHGTAVPDDRVVPSEVIVPPADITLEEAQRYFTDEGLMQPLPA